MKRTRREKDATADALEWLADHDGVRAHFAALRVAARLSKSPFVRIEGLLPPRVADACLDLLRKHERWEEMNDDELEDDADHDVDQIVQHRFLFSDPQVTDGSGDASARAVSLLTDALSLLFEDLVPSFSVSCYRQGDCIGPHDDKAHVQASPVGGGRVRLHSRKIAAVLHLSKGWQPSFGGAFVDLEGQKEYFPTFNTLLLFQVPRMHFVGPVLTARERRYSVFGWFLAPGKLYELDDAEGHEASDESSEESEASGDVSGDEDEGDASAAAAKLRYDAGKAQGKRQGKAQGKAQGKGQGKAQGRAPGRAPGKPKRGRRG